MKNVEIYSYVGEQYFTDSIEVEDDRIEALLDNVEENVERTLILRSENAVNIYPEGSIYQAVVVE